LTALLNQSRLSDKMSVMLRK